MARTRISTTVDGELLRMARTSSSARNHAELIDEALSALVGQHRRAVIDAEYDKAYEEHPLEEPDEWGDLASFREAAAAT